MKILTGILTQGFQLVLYIFSLLLLVAMVFYVVFTYETQTSTFELATVAGLLGGFALAGGLLDTKLPSLSFSLRRIGALYLVSTIALIFFGLFVPIDKQNIPSMARITKIVMPISFYLGALSFIVATVWFLWLVPSFFRRHDHKR